MTSRNPPKIGIVVLNINQYEHTVNGFRSLAELTYPNSEAVLVDNGSTDACVAQIQDALPELKILRNPTNLGFSEGNNIGIRYCIRTLGCDHVLLLNNDTELDPKFLTCLVDRLEGDDRLAAVAPKIYFYSDRERIWDFGGLYDEETGNLSTIGFKEVDRGQFERSEPQYLCACSILIRGEALLRVGLLDPALFYYCEDVDWSLRARAAGYHLATDGRAHVWHKVSQTIESSWIAYIWARNRAAVRWKNRRTSFGAFFDRYVREICGDVRWDLGQGRALAATTKWMGLLDFCLGRFGKGRIAVGRELQNVGEPLRPPTWAIRAPMGLLVIWLWILWRAGFFFSPGWRSLRARQEASLADDRVPTVLSHLVPPDWKPPGLGA